MPQARSSGSGSSSGGSSGRSSSRRSTSSRSTSSRSTGTRSAGTRSTGSRSTGTGRTTRSSSGGRSRSSSAGASGAASAASAATAAAAEGAAAVDERLEATVKRVRKLNERIIDAGKDAGEATLSSYEKALKAIATTIERGAGKSDVEWISTLATTQAKFLRDVTDAWVSAARGMLK
jgi:hypothetical protein